MSEASKNPLDGLYARASEASLDPQERLAAALALMFGGYFNHAARLLPQLLGLRPVGQRVAWRICQQLLAGEALRQAVVGPLSDIPGPALPRELAWDGGHWVGIMPRPGATRIMILLQGMHTLNAVNKLRFTTDRSTHMIVVRDPSDFHYVNGIRGLGRDFRASAEALARLGRKLAGEHAQPEFHCLGTSRTSYAAIRLALELEASGVLAFSAITAPPAEAQRAYVERVPELASLHPIDLLEQYASRQRTPKTLLCYGRHNRHDTFQAERMARRPGIVLLPIDTSDHNTLGVVLRNGTFDPLIDRLYGVSAEAPAAPSSAAGDAEPAACEPMAIPAE